MEECFEESSWIYNDEDDKCGTRTQKYKWLTDGVELFLEQEDEHARADMIKRLPQSEREVYKYVPAFGTVKRAPTTAPSLQAQRHQKQMGKLLNGYENKKFH